MTIKNPILTGFNPDPSIVAVDDDFYIATSTFEWFPGVQIHHSKDLKNWRLLDSSSGSCKSTRPERMPTFRAESGLLVLHMQMICSG